MAINKSFIDSYETSKLSIGNSGLCNATHVEVEVGEVLLESALLKWKTIPPADEASVIKYSVFYSEISENSDAVLPFRDDE